MTDNETRMMMTASARREAVQAAGEAGADRQIIFFRVKLNGLINKPDEGRLIALEQVVRDQFLKFVHVHAARAVDDSTKSCVTLVAELNTDLDMLTDHFVTEVKNGWNGCFMPRAIPMPIWLRGDKQ